MEKGQEIVRGRRWPHSQPAASQGTPIYEALRNFAAAVADKRAQLTAGAPEEQLRTPFDNLMSELGAAWGLPVVCTGEAPLLAPLCRMLRDDVADALQDAQSPLVALAQDWRQLLFPDATDAEFADAYAQTVAFALLLGRSEGAEPLRLESAQQALATQHSLLSRALQVLTDPRAQTDMAASLGLLLRVLSVVPRNLFLGAQDPWLHFYEDFLAAYDPKLRKNTGAYYTPLEVVHAQVRLVDELLVSRLGKPAGFADPEVFTLDPALGTGTYLLGVIEHALGRVEARQGAGAVAGQAAQLAKNLYGFELLVGPYAVSELRISRA